MIVEKTCFCGVNICANGDDRFNDAVKSHFKSFHPDIFVAIENLRKQAEIELSDLRNKYPELYLAYGYFHIDNNKLLGDSVD